MTSAMRPLKRPTMPLVLGVLVLRFNKSLPSLIRSESTLLQIIFAEVGMARETGWAALVLT